MIPIRKFIQDVSFDRIDSYRINHQPEIHCILKFDKYEILDSFGNKLPNSIVGKNLISNTTAEHITSLTDPKLIDKFRNLFVEDSVKPLNQETPLYKNSLLFYKGNVVVGGINVSFNQGILCTINHEFLSITQTDFGKLRAFFFADLKHNPYEAVSYFGNIANKWQEHLFPDFYFNPHWKLYETTIGTPILCLNTNRAKLQIETEEGVLISPAQLKRATYVKYYPFAQKRKMFEMIFSLYNEMRSDYDLPEIKGDIESILPFFVRLNSVTIPVNDKDDILLSFSNWDEEHGLYIRINEVGDKMEFDF
ncbi:hypothetical protein [Xanthocytophaga agilis]|uniref:Uncharacterized protein n=1 Tax=Xanthocytophaga agilis TaxID=3048010 RepID=A0AAE3R934_9BACT|nr:hypothetical protein [Xanthocytophaga agilis]MDJ1503740.1 hypothetical protein [Xanthocytophaga agilis]